MSTLTTLASTLLVFGSVLKGAVGEAFLTALAATGKYQATNKDVLAAYGKLYNLLLQAGHNSWEEYLIDQVRRLALCCCNMDDGWQSGCVHLPTRALNQDQDPTLHACMAS